MYLIKSNKSNKKTHLKIIKRHVSLHMYGMWIKDKNSLHLFFLSLMIPLGNYLLQ